MLGWKRVAVCRMGENMGHAEWWKASSSLRGEIMPWSGHFSTRQHQKKSDGRALWMGICGAPGDHPRDFLTAIPVSLGNS